MPLCVRWGIVEFNQAAAWSTGGAGRVTVDSSGMHSEDELAIEQLISVHNGAQLVVRCESYSSCD